MTNKIYNLIQEGKTTDVRNKLKKYSTSVLHEVNAVNYLKTIDIKDFLEFDEAVNTQGYVLEKDIKKFLSTTNGKEITHYKFNKYKQFILKEFDLQSVYLNQELKEELDIQHLFSKNQSPKVIVKSSLCIYLNI